MSIKRLRRHPSYRTVASPAGPCGIIVGGQDANLVAALKRLLLLFR